MEIRQIIRLSTFSYLNFLPNLLGFWIIAILPEIIENNLHVKDKSMHSTIAGFYLSYFYWGIIIGSFFWPYALNFVSKRTALFIAIALQGGINALTGQTTNLTLIYFLRFAAGFMHNVNTVGKDFVFEFAKSSYRQYAYSLKVVFTYLASFGGPIFGYYLYLYTGKSFALSMIYISSFYLIGVVLFVIVFYVDYTPGDINEPVAHHDEEVKPLKNSENQEEAHQKGIWEVLWHCLGRSDLRNLIIVYFLTNGVYKSSNMISVFFLETAWENQGLGVSSMVVSLIALVAFIPAAAIVLASPIYVPSKFSYKAFIKLFIILMIVGLISLPLLRDLIPEKNHEKYIWIAYVIQGFLYLSVPKMYSPFINYYLNNNVDKYSRTSLNSITFILSNLAGAITLSLIGPLFSYTLFSPTFQGYQVYSKYVCFVIMNLLLLGALYCLKGFKSENK